MNAPRRPQFLGATLIAAALLSASAAAAKTTGVVEDARLQSGPCYEALVDKNESNPTTAPKRELGAACQAEDGDIDKAWARVIRLWGSDSEALPDYDSYTRADAPLDQAPPTWLAALGVLLTYAVLGAPMRAAARLFGAYPGPAKGAAVDVLAGLVVRAALCAAFAALFALPYGAALGALALILWSALVLGRRPASPLESASGSLATHLSELINDATGACLPLAAFALFVRAHGILFLVAVALALVASVGPVIAARRSLRATPLRATLVASVLAAAFGEALLVAPPVSRWMGGLTGATFLVPLAAAALTFALGLALAKPAKLIADEA